MGTRFDAPPPYPRHDPDATQPWLPDMEAVDVPAPPPPPPPPGSAFDSGSPQAYPDWQVEDAPRPWWRRRWLAAGLAGVVVVAVAGLLLGMFGGGDDSGSPTPTPAAMAGPARAQAAALDRLLAGSSADRRSVVSAVASIRQCRDLAAANAALRKAAANRQAHVTALNGLDVSQIPGGPQLVTTLRTAWQRSADADLAFARWGDQAVRDCAGGHAKQSSDLRLAVQASQEATQAKQDFLAQWNALSPRFGLPTRTPTEI